MLTDIYSYQLLIATNPRSEVESAYDLQIFDPHSSYQVGLLGVARCDIFDGSEVRTKGGFEQGVINTLLGDILRVGPTICCIWEFELDSIICGQFQGLLRPSLRRSTQFQGA